MNKLDYNDKPITALSLRARKTLSSLLNPKKVIPSDGPVKLPRYWRGLASLVNISTETALHISTSTDPTNLVLNAWVEEGNEATIGKLLEYLEKIDRYDAQFDLIDLGTQGLLLASDTRINKTADLELISQCDSNETNDLITYQDAEHSKPQFYHAYVLYADADEDFVNEMLVRMRDNGYKLCTKRDILPNYSTQFNPISRLILERCNRIILVYSPDFLKSPDNAFYIDYAQAVGIQLKKPKIIPCVYKPCELPPNHTFYHKLHYNLPGDKSVYNFWTKLSQSLSIAKIPNSDQTPEIEAKLVQNGFHQLHTNFLSLPEPRKSVSMNNISHNYDSCSTISVHSDVIVEKKKGPLKKIINSITRRSKKKTLVAS